MKNAASVRQALAFDIRGTCIARCQLTNRDAPVKSRRVQASFGNFPLSAPFMRYRDGLGTEGDVGAEDWPWSNCVRMLTRGGLRSGSRRERIAKRQGYREGEVK